uniref:BUB1 N-terminal domain-containing protein n=1 Tax=Romanomermis culicivorax TaxID=13658 RepID=A0A915IJ36_ROMCU
LRFTEIFHVVSWEASKENYKPLKSGRLAAPLNGTVNLATFTNGGSLVLCNSKQMSVKYNPNIEEMKRWFEEKIKNKDDKDPLDYWYQYVKCFEQTFPTGKDKEIRRLAFDCIKALKNRTEYSTRDRRWWYIFYKAASLSTNSGSLSIYQVMYEEGQCKEVADFYKEWGLKLEQTGNFSEARRVYNLGIQAGAQPIRDLHNALEDLEVRVSRKLCEPSDDEEFEDTRQILGVLKGVAKLVNQQPITQSGFIGFSVFDENSSSQSNVRISKATQNVPLSVIKQDNREENFREPNLWPKEKIKATAKVTPIQNSTNFQVLDESEGFKVPTVESRKLAKESAIKKLECKPIPSLKSAATSKSSTEFKEVHVWNVKQIYDGSVEMSNEEILAEKWFAKHKIDTGEIEHVDMEETPASKINSKNLEIDEEFGFFSRQDFLSLSHADNILIIFQIRNVYVHESRKF